VNRAAALRLLVVLALVLAAAAILVLPRRFGEPSRLGMDSAPNLPAAIDLDAQLVTRGAWYELAFTAPRFPDNPAARRGGIDETLVALMDRSRRTLDVAVYEFNLANVADAMARAADRAGAHGHRYRHHRRHA